MGLKILVCSSEIVPFAKTGGLADVAGALPRALVKQGQEVRVALPQYRAVDLQQAKPEPIARVPVPLVGQTLDASVAVSHQIPDVPAYLVGCPRFFDRERLYGERDDAERFAFFCRAMIEFLRQSDWVPDVIHCNDWQTALIPVYLKTIYNWDEPVCRAATLLTIHNLAYQGVFDPFVLASVGLHSSLFTMDKLEFFGKVNFLKGGMVFADLLSTVSKTYAEEIQTPEYGERLAGVLAQRKGDLFGVLNGIDGDEWNPATDRLIEANYTAAEASGKAADKAALQRRLGLPENPKVPLLGIVTRLAGQKGLDLLAEVLPSLLTLDVQFALLGTGEPEYHESMGRLAREHPQKMAAVLGFDNALAHQIYAGADFFLMPSHYEPCGLGQMISLRYGTTPVVRHTGGLADTVEEYDPETKRGNGFSFVERSPVALFAAIVRGLLVMKSATAWKRLVRQAMKYDFSWGRSAEEYVGLYERARARRGS